MAGGSAASSRRPPLSLAEVEPGSENERLGLARDSMFRNPRILKAEVGKPLRNCYTLPGFDFAYGLYIPRTDGGVPEAIGHWNTVNQNRTDLVQKMPRDFITMNRGALKAGYTTAREYNLYYKDKDIRRKEEECTRLKKGPIKLPADMTFGIPARYRKANRVKLAQHFCEKTHNPLRRSPSGTCPAWRRLGLTSVLFQIVMLVKRRSALPIEKCL
ncbi:cilia- and flagella-associated protein 77 isoform X4 [Columba livia]|uniref:cilia- and flagella-associated protein 77 isoform X4 n=1 Tax=Columba livia TaxID=8932 RepID=UPI0031BAD319